MFDRYAILAKASPNNPELDVLLEPSTFILLSESKGVCADLPYQIQLMHFIELFVDRPNVLFLINDLYEESKTCEEPEIVKSFVEKFIVKYDSTLIQYRWLLLKIISKNIGLFDKYEPKISNLLKTPDGLLHDITRVVCKRLEHSADCIIHQGNVPSTLITAIKLLDSKAYHDFDDLFTTFIITKFQEFSEMLTNDTPECVLLSQFYALRILLKRACCVDVVKSSLQRDAWMETLRTKAPKAKKFAPGIANVLKAIE